jgi:hypothetical protein
MKGAKGDVFVWSEEKFMPRRKRQGIWNSECLSGAKEEASVQHMYKLDKRTVPP